MQLRQSTIRNLQAGPFLTSSGTLGLGLTIASGNIRLSRNGGVYSSKNDSAGFISTENGYYSGYLDTIDTSTCGELLLSITVSGVLPWWHRYTVVPANVYDSMILGTDNLDSDLLTSTISTIIASGNAANWSGLTPVTDLTLVNSKLDTISGYTDTLESTLATLPTIDVIIASGNASAWPNNNTGLATQTDVNTARDVIINSGNLSWITAVGFATPSNVTTTEANLSGQIAGLNDVSISQIINSGKVEGWGDVTPVTGLATQIDVTNARDVIINSGDANWSTAVGFSTPTNITDSEDNISGYIAGLNNVSIGAIIASGNAANWAADTIQITVSGLTPDALSQIVASGNAANWSDNLIIAGTILTSKPTADASIKNKIEWLYEAATGETTTDISTGNPIMTIVNASGSVIGTRNISGTINSTTLEVMT